MAGLTLKVLAGEFSVHRLDADAPVPDAVLQSGPYWIGKTDEELSIVCASGVPVPGSRADAGWSCMKVSGPLDLDATGILAGLSSALAGAGVSLLALSTHDTDYLLVRSRSLSRAIAALAGAGYAVDPPTAAGS